MRLFVLSVLVLLAGVAYLYGKYPDVRPAQSIRLRSTPEVVARGEYLFNQATVCADRQSRRDCSTFAGPIDPGTLGIGSEELAPELIPALPAISAMTEQMFNSSFTLYERVSDRVLITRPAADSNGRAVEVLAEDDEGGIVGNLHVPAAA